MLGVASIVTVGELHLDFSQIAHPDRFAAHSAQKDCGRGVLPFTRMYLMASALHREIIVLPPCFEIL